MAHIKIRMTLARGLPGVPLGHLSKATKALEDFLHVLSIENGIELDPCKWVAECFNDKHSVAFSAMNLDQCTDSQFIDYNRSFDYVANFDPDKDEVCYVSGEVMEKWVELGSKALPDVPIYLGYYATPLSKKAKSVPALSKSKAMRLKKFLTDRIVYNTTLLCEISSLQIDQLYINIRDVATGQIFKCYFDDDKYKDILGSIYDRGSRIYISGMVTTFRVGLKVEKMKLENLETAPVYQDGDLEKLHGLFPDMTGEESTSDFIDKVRHDD